MWRENFVHILAPVGENLKYSICNRFAYVIECEFFYNPQLAKKNLGHTITSVPLNRIEEGTVKNLFQKAKILLPIF